MFVQEQSLIRRHIGYPGGVVIVALVATAAVINPIPNAPIALAAGAAFDHFRGGCVVIATGIQVE